MLSATRVVGNHVKDMSAGPVGLMLIISMIVQLQTRDLPVEIDSGTAGVGVALRRRLDVSA
jgi:hypothetical protein